MSVDSDFHGSRAIEPRAERFLGWDEPSQQHRQELQRLEAIGARWSALFLLLVGGWMVFATIEGAVVSAGQFVVDNENRKVQHQTGGVVAALHVREGAPVEAGQLLMRLDETVLKSTLMGTTKQLDELLIRRARLEAEREEAPEMAFPSELDGRQSEPEIGRLWTTETNNFQFRREARANKLETLEKRIGQLEAESAGYHAQLAAGEAQRKLINEELVGVRELFAKKLVPTVRLNALEREAKRLDGQIGQLQSAVAQSTGKIAEVRLQMRQAIDESVAEINKDLRETQVRIYELSERAVGMRDQLQRVEIRAPTSGFVHQLQAHTIGGVISPAEPVMLIVPSRETLKIDAKVAPQDIDQIVVGQTATIKIHAFNTRTTPELKGAVERVSADIVKDQQSQIPHYVVRIGIAPEEFDRLEGKRVIAGMQTEVFIKTAERSPIGYLAKPLLDQMDRAMRER
jgi:HlyD family secretion protein